MRRRLALALVLATLVQIGWSGAPAFADDNEGSDDKGEDDNEGSDDNSGEESGDDAPEQEDDGTSEGTEAADHDRARAAVETDAAIPLKRLLALFRKDFDGKVVDIALVRRSAGLVYRVKFIDATGRVRRVEYDATTGSRLD